MGKNKDTIDVEKVALIIDSEDEDNDINLSWHATRSSSPATSQNNSNVISIDLTKDDDEPLPPAYTRITPLPSSATKVPPKSPLPKAPLPKASAPKTSLPKNSTSMPTPKPPLLQKGTSSLPQRQTSLSSQQRPSAYSQNSQQRPNTSIPNAAAPIRPASSSLPCIPTLSSPQKCLSSTTSSPSTSRAATSTSVPSSIERNSSLIPPISKAIHSSDRKLSLPRSALISKTAASLKKTSAIVKAATISPIRKPPQPVLRRPIDSPERPPAKSIFKKSPSHQVFGSPERPRSQSIFSNSPPRMTTNSPIDLRRAKQSSSPFSRPTVFEKRPVYYDIEDEDGEEEDLDTFISMIISTRKTVKIDNTPKAINMQCPLCYYYFPRSEMGGHASECTGKGIDPEDDDDGPRIGTKRVIRKNTIGDAVRLDENERKRLNKGQIDIGPTNYYADSESILALDGVGFNSEVTGMAWESAGQTRFG